MMANRRKVLKRAITMLSTAWLAPRFALADISPSVSALDKSELIYLTPIVSGGKESACHGEVWFVHHNQEIFVVTKDDAWRAEATRKGFNKAKIWIGEFGPWKKANNHYLSAPYLQIEGQLETDPAVHASVLEVYGAKYSDEWSSWGPRFKDGLADGSRVMLRYKVAS
ncbi:MAG: hypothetical protein O3C28_04575 [Proteobacteria bacterium]|nr:hypothetical protein [Pseudomonadota bacterium]